MGAGAGKQSVVEKKQTHDAGCLVGFTDEKKRANEEGCPVDMRDRVKSGGPCLLVFVRSFDGAVTPVDVGIDATVHDLLTAYRRGTYRYRGTYLPTGGRIVYQEKPLPPHDTLADWGVCPETVVEYMPQKGGWKPQTNKVLESAVNLLSRTMWKVTDEVKRYLAVNHLGADPPVSYLMRDWDVSEVTSMTGLFSSTNAGYTFNEDITRWDTGAVTSMRWMFSYSHAFNQDIGKWDTGAVTDMSSMFQGAAAFNQDIGQWDTTSVTDMKWMFYRASSFNQDVSKWDMSAVEDVKQMFHGTLSFDQVSLVALTTP